MVIKLISKIFLSLVGLGILGVIIETIVMILPVPNPIAVFLIVVGVLGWLQYFEEFSPIMIRGGRIYYGQIRKTRPIKTRR